MSIYFRSSMGIDFPKAPYLGQSRNEPDLNMELWENLFPLMI